jgi:acyl-coenzyme A thioesterase PaaI-like protein
VKYNRKQLESHCEKLERLYLSTACNEYFDLGIRIAEGEAEIVIPIDEKFLGVAGTLHDSVCFTAMADSARCAVNSIVNNALVVTCNLNMHLDRPIVAKEIMARSRFVGMSGDQYLAESVLTDSQGGEIGRASGAFVPSEIRLSAEMGYE